MIDINLSIEHFTLEIRGHAQPEETEQYKEICSGCSMLAQGMAYSITKFQKKQNGIRAIEYRGNPGDMLLKVQPDPWAEATVRKRMRAYGDGLELMAKSHPESVRMAWDGIRVEPEKEAEAIE